LEACGRLAGVCERFQGQEGSHVAGPYRRKGSTKEDKFGEGIRQPKPVCDRSDIGRQREPDLGRGCELRRLVDKALNGGSIGYERHGADGCRDSS
jgi:hypothetical protein